MKISTQGQSRFLMHDDVRTPIVATMERVTEDRTLRNPYVLHFTPECRLKPLPLNVTNRRILVAAFGDDDAAWHGQLVELYFNPSIPNPRNPQLPGGICVRIHPTSTNGHAHATAPKPDPPRPAAATPTPQPSPRPAAANGTAAAGNPLPLAAERSQAIEAFRRADTKENADRWKRWVDSIRFDDTTRAELGRAYVTALQRIRTARQPAPARQ